jgi:hypothetical protein
MLNGKLENAGRKKQEADQPYGSIPGNCPTQVHRALDGCRSNLSAARTTSRTNVGLAIAAERTPATIPTIPTTYLWSVPASIDDTTWHLPDLGMMRQDMHSAVAPAEKGAQEPTNDTDQNRTPKCASEVINMESHDHARHPVQHEGIDNQNEES